MFGMGRSRTTEEASLTVGRGPVPRHAPVSQKTFAGDRPPRDGMGDSRCAEGEGLVSVRDQAIPNYRGGIPRLTDPRHPSSAVLP